MVGIMYKRCDSLESTPDVMAGAALAAAIFILSRNAGGCALINIQAFKAAIIMADSEEAFPAVAVPTRERVDTLSCALFRVCATKQKK